MTLPPRWRLRSKSCCDFEGIDDLVEKLGAVEAARALVKAREYFEANKDGRPENERPQPMTATEWRKILQEDMEEDMMEEDDEGFLEADEEESAEEDEEAGPVERLVRRGMKAESALCAALNVAGAQHRGAPGASALKDVLQAVEDDTSEKSLKEERWKAFFVRHEEHWPPESAPNCSHRNVRTVKRPYLHRTRPHPTTTAFDPPHRPGASTTTPLGSSLEDFSQKEAVEATSQMSRTVADLEAKLNTMKKMALLQTAETKAALASLEEKLSLAEEEAAEKTGALDVSEAHAKDLEQQLMQEPPANSRGAEARTEMARRRKAEEEPYLTGAVIPTERPVSFLQMRSVEEIAAMKAELAQVKAKIEEEQRLGRSSNEQLLSESREVVASQRKLQKLQKEAKRMEREAKKKDAAFTSAEQKLGVGTLRRATSSTGRVVGTALAAGSKPQVVAMARQIGAARMELQELRHQRLQLRQQLREQQEALDRTNLDVKRHSEHVELLKTRGKDLEQLMRNMDQADEKQLCQATDESKRVQSFFASMDQDRGRSRGLLRVVGSEVGRGGVREWRKASCVSE
eukprot:g21053.t1